MTDAIRTDNRYTFGDGDAAERRLADIATFFNAAAESFLRAHVGEPVGTVVDLGCGPGFTTEMLCRALAAHRVVGLDVSDDFLRRAAARLPGCSFVQHDARLSPFPVAADLIYCRFLLSHLPNAATHVDRWTRELAPDGRLFIDELEDIETDVPAFRRYLEVSAGLVASQGADMWVGAALGAASYGGPVLLSERQRLEVPNPVAASWFHPNTVTVWEREPFVRQRLSLEERREIGSMLAETRDTGKPAGHATWVMRRMILMRSQHGGEVACVR
jgi:SAM-dependent methyltransferase